MLGIKMKLTIEEIEKRLKQGQVNFIGSSIKLKVLITRNKALQYKAVISSGAFNTVFQNYNEFNGLNYWLENRIRGNDFFYDLACWLHEKLYD
jgi:phosphoserine phosphatase